MSDTNDVPHEAEHDDPDAPVTVADKDREPTPYERQLRTQSLNYRRRLREAERDRDDKIAVAARERDEAIAAAHRERDEKIASTRHDADQRLVRAEMKAAAVRAGMVDPDGLKLLDLSGVKLGEDGEIVIPDGFFEAAKQAKPFLFGSAPSSTNPAPAPRNEPTSPTRATDWTPEQMRDAERRLAAGQRLTA